MKRLRHFAAIILPIVHHQVATAREIAPVTIANVRVETMTDQRAIRRGYIVIRGGKIAAVGAGRPPRRIGGALIDGRGGTVMPGLADMHVHYNDPTMGVAFVANGITTVRNMYGALQHARLDEAAKLGGLIGPRVYTSGPIINSGYFVKVDNPDQAIGAVRSQAESGYGAVKLYQDLSPASIRAAVAEARAKGMKVYCHVPFSMSVYDVLDLRVDSIEHLTGYGVSLARDGFRSNGKGAFSEYWANADPAKFQALAQRTAASGTWSVPTFALTYGSQYSSDPATYFARPGSAQLSRETVDGWKMFANRLAADQEFVDSGLRGKIAFVAELRRAGAPILIGTDAPNPFVTPGYSIHDEFQAFSQAGYSNLEILRIATVEAARFLGQSADQGTLTAGARADLVLLSGNPEVDLNTLRRPLGVMVNGHWYDRHRIEQALAGVATNNRRTERTRVGS